jgi:hypothetical protein
MRLSCLQVVAKPQFKFLESRIYSESAVVVWDPAGYSASLQQWYTRPGTYSCKKNILSDGFNRNI